jgi:membrane associated rhomboid family serine protease/predicted negative regulator of RcsB-dependent stress response
MAKCVQCGRNMPGFSLKKKCSWCEQYEAAQRGEVSEVQHVMPTPWHQSVATAAPVTTALLALNFLVFVLMIAQGVSVENPGSQDLIRWGANFGPLTLSGQWWRLVSHMFLHIGFFHLALNMWFLYSLGPECERFLGSVTYAVLYFFSGIAGGLASLMWNPHAVSAGASGALFGVLGAMIAAYKFGESSLPSSLIRGRLQSLLVCVGISVVWGFVGRIDNAAHAGGFVIGLIGGILVAKAAPDESNFAGRALILVLIAALVGGAFWWVRYQRPVDPQITRTRVYEYLQKNRINDAVAELERSVKRSPNDTGSRLMLATLYTRLGKHAEAMQQSEWVLTHSNQNDYARTMAGTFIACNFISNKRFDEGEKYFSAMVAKDPTDEVPHQSLGELAEAQNQHDVAVNEYQKVIALQPSQFGAFAGLGRSYTKLKRYDDAIAAYNKAIELSDEGEDDEFGFHQELKAVEKLKQDSTPAK